jgi:hypothetical protein
MFYGKLYVQLMYAEYGHILIIDATYKVNIEGFPVLVFLVEDNPAGGVPIMFRFGKHETVDILFMFFNDL